MTAPDMEAPGEVGTEGRAQGTGESQDSATADEAERKEFATAAAEAALCGCQLHKLDDGYFLLSLGAMSKELPCLRAVGDLLRRIGRRV